MSKKGDTPPVRGMPTWLVVVLLAALCAVSTLLWARAIGCGGIGDYIESRRIAQEWR